MTAGTEIDVVSPESVGLSAARLGRVSDWLGEQVARERLAGGSVLIGRRGKVAFFEARGLADRAARRAARPHGRPRARAGGPSPRATRPARAR